MSIFWDEDKGIRFETDHQKKAGPAVYVRYPTLTLNNPLKRGWDTICYEVWRDADGNETDCFIMVEFFTPYTLEEFIEWVEMYSL